MLGSRRPGHLAAPLDASQGSDRRTAVELTRDRRASYDRDMPAKNLMLEVLKQIRDEVRKTNQRLDQTNERLDQTNVELRGTKDEVHGLGERADSLERRQLETETRLATEIVAVAQAVREVKDLLAQRLDLNDKVQDHEKRIVVLEHRTGP
jgi:archaellum component FlaC